MTEFDFDRVTVLKSETVTVHEMGCVGWVAVSVGALFIIGIAVGLCRSPSQSPVAETWPDADTADTSDASCRVCPTCPAYACVCQSYTWLGRFMSAIDEEAQSPDEIRDIAYLAYHESRYTPSAVSSAGAVGICQIKPDAWPDVDMSLLVEDPDYAAVQCLRIYRIYRSKCGAKWYRCYRMGVAGARAAEAASKEKNR